MMQEQPLKFYKTKSNKMITKKTLLTDTKTRNSIIYEVITSVLSYKVTLKYHENTVQLVTVNSCITNHSKTSFTALILKLHMDLYKLFRFYELRL